MTSRSTIPHTAEGAIRAIKLLAERDAEIATLRAANSELLVALSSLIVLNNDWAPFGGEFYQDRLDRAWDRARRAYDKHKGGGA